MTEYVVLYEPTSDPERIKAIGPVASQQAAEQTIDTIREDFQRAWFVPLRSA